MIVAGSTTLPQVGVVVRETPSRDMLRSADSRIAVADSPCIATGCPVEVTNPALGASGRAPTLVAMTISSRTWSAF